MNMDTTLWTGSNISAKREWDKSRRSAASKWTRQHRGVRDILNTDYLSLERGIHKLLLIKIFQYIFETSQSIGLPHNVIIKIILF